MKRSRLVLLASTLLLLQPAACDEFDSPNPAGSHASHAADSDQTDTAEVSDVLSGPSEIASAPSQPVASQDPPQPGGSNDPPPSDPPPSNPPPSNPPPSNPPPSDPPPSDPPPSDPPPSDPFDMLTDEERTLYDLLMAYRQDNGLPAIPLSPSLTLVAQAHATDLELHAAEVLVDGCNMHSWSSHGDWIGCCYPGNHSNMPCMHNKPREMTAYTGSGYEISVGGTHPVSASGALSAWQGSQGHNDVILNVGTWSQEWRAVGIGIDGRYGHVWFGREADPALQP